MYSKILFNPFNTKKLSAKMTLFNFVSKEISILPVKKTKSEG